MNVPYLINDERNDHDIKLIQDTVDGSIILVLLRKTVNAELVIKQ